MVGAGAVVAAIAPEVSVGSLVASFCPSSPLGLSDSAGTSVATGSGAADMVGGGASVPAAAGDAGIAGVDAAGSGEGETGSDWHPTSQAQSKRAMKTIVDLVCMTINIL